MWFKSSAKTAVHIIQYFAHFDIWGSESCDVCLLECFESAQSMIFPFSFVQMSWKFLYLATMHTDCGFSSLGHSVTWDLLGERRWGDLEGTQTIFPVSICQQYTIPGKRKSPNLQSENPDCPYGGLLQIQVLLKWFAKKVIQASWTKHMESGRKVCFP